MTQALRGENGFERDVRTEAVRERGPQDCVWRRTAVCPCL